MKHSEQRQIGAIPSGRGPCHFCVWAPHAKDLQIEIVTPEPRSISLEKDARGYFRGKAPGVRPGSRYFVRMEDWDRYPDPASRFQPEGVFGPSEVVDTQFAWKDHKWRGLPLEDYILYELHVGTFSPAGTFSGVGERLDYLKELGVTAIELMPVSQFAGERNWGYDGVFPFAVQNSYGGPNELKAFVNRCHQNGLAVVLDVVYNHLGPEGNILRKFGPYFTDIYQTPWGSALNLDGPYSDEVRELFIQNARQWVDEFHIDALRLDALQTLLDRSPRPFLQELSEQVHGIGEAQGRQIYLMAESDQNDSTLLRPKAVKGMELDAHWNDDFHHALHVLLTKENNGYYQDFGELVDLEKSFREAYVYSGNYSPFRKRRHGTDVSDLSPSRFIVCSQNHDQIGNRPDGARLTQDLDMEALKLVAATVILSPYLPLLFMGEEYGEIAPFQYFVDFSTGGLQEAVRKGRENECSAFGWRGSAPDPNAVDTFQRSCLNHTLLERPKHGKMFAYYQELLKLRRDLPELRSAGRDQVEVRSYLGEEILMWKRSNGDHESIGLLCFGLEAQSIPWPKRGARYEKILDSYTAKFGGSGPLAQDQIQVGQETRLEVGGRNFLLYRKKAPSR